MTISSQNFQDLMNKDEALSLIHEIKNNVNSIRQKLILLKTKEGWKSLGYQSFDECCDKEFKTIMSSKNFYDLLAAVKTEEALNKLEVSGAPENIS